MWFNRCWMWGHNFRFSVKGVEVSNHSRGVQGADFDYWLQPPTAIIYAQGWMWVSPLITLCDRTVNSAHYEERLNSSDSHQVNVGHKVSVESGGDAKSPDPVAQRLPDSDVEDLAHGREAAAGLAGSSGVGDQRLVGEAGQHEDEHEDSEGS